MSEKQISGSLKWNCSENQQPFHWISNLEGEALRWWISLNQKPSTAKEFRDTFAHRFIINNAETTVGQNSSNCNSNRIYWKI